MASATLYVSGEELTSCEAVARAMQDLGIAGHVTSNRTVMGPSGIELGCSVLVSRYDRFTMLRLWDRLRRQFTLQCAHYEVHWNASGCVLDLQRDSCCPNASQCLRD